jgi:TnpA family transposase
MITYATAMRCRYLVSSELRREIQDGLNVVENWNSANGVVFFVEGEEITPNK